VSPRLLRALSLIAALVVALPVARADTTKPFPVEIRAIPISNFRIASSDTRFGAFEFVGGIELRAQESAFGQLSSMRFLSPGTDFIGVADHGYWFFGSIERDSNHVPIGVRDFRMQGIVDRTGALLERKADKDAEGLDVFDGVATVAFERNARVAQYAVDPAGMAGPLRELDFIIPRGELRHNQGFETIVHAPRDSALQGALVVIAERSVDPQGNIFAAILDGPQRGMFKVRRSDEFDVTDGVFLPGGDLLLLERRFSLSHGVGMRLRRIAGDSLRKGALVDGDTLMEVGLTHRIDNMEAIDAWRREDGELVISLMSDDNQSFLQRTLYLEFVLSGD
jgi:hypothetical protein